MESIAVSQAKAKAPEAGSWLMAAVLVAGHAIKHMYAAGFLLLLPDIRLGLGLSNADIGGIVTARGLAGGLTNLPAGFLADRSSRHWPAILGLTMVVIGVFQFIMGSAAQHGAIVACIVVVGAAISFWHPAAIAALSQRFADRRGFAIALHGAGGSIGEALGPVAVGALLLTLTWQGVLQFSLVPALLAGAVVWALMRNVHGASRPHLTVALFGESLRRLVSSPGLRTVMVVTGITAMATAGFTTFLPVYLRIDLGYPPNQAAAFVFASQVAGIASQPIMGYFSDRFGRLSVVVPSVVLLGFGMLAVVAAAPGWQLAATVALVGAFQFPTIALFLAAAMDFVEPNTQATTVSLVYGVSFLTGSISPSVAGRLADHWGVPSVFAYAGGMALLAAVTLILTKDNLKPPARLSIA